MFSLVSASHDSSFAAFGVFKTFEVVAALSFIFHEVIEGRVDSLVTALVTFLDSSKFLNHAIHWFIAELIQVIISSFIGNCYVLAAVKREEIGIL